CITFFHPTKSHTSEARKDVHSVYARGILKDIEYFDAKFFNYSPKEAHLSDPQHRLFIESAWKALEKSGYATDLKTTTKIGVYASMNDSTYVLDHCLAERNQGDFAERSASQRLMSSQFLATKIAYLFDCTGPSFTLQTACSSSLVAIALACQQLSSYRCDMALAGGISIVTPQDRPYIYQPNNIYSPDGHCRPFDENAAGTVFSNGLGVVVLKRLADAIRDHDTIISVIKGYSINNDGGHKMSYAAPSTQGQIDCILTAKEVADISLDSVQYIETHGTGTAVGDPIEIDALTKAFRTSSNKEQFCAIGSVKANIGHTHVAAGVAGLIKASLALQHKQIPPNLHFTKSNPSIDFKHSPFYVSTRLQHWPESSSPRRAAVSAFGVGGTNAHIILEEAPKSIKHPAKRQYYSLLLSAKSEQALNDYHEKLIAFLEKAKPQPSSSLLANLAYTLQVGRKNYPYRSGIIVENISDAITKLSKNKSKIIKPITNINSGQAKIVFLFPGQGTQYINASRGLYETEPVYKKYLDKCLITASNYINENLPGILFPKKENQPKTQLKLLNTRYTHPILFAIEYALAKLLISWGIKPDAMLGHSLGEYVAACLADVFSLEEALKLVCARGNAIANCHGGAMLAVPLSTKNIIPLLNDETFIAVESTPNLCVISGTFSGMQAFKENICPILAGKSLATYQLDCSHPFHSLLLKPAKKPLAKVLKSIKQNLPKIPYLSNVTGDWINQADIQNGQYWIDQMLKTVKLSSCMKKLAQHKNVIYIEVGPGNTLRSSLQHHAKTLLQSTSTLPNAKSATKESDDIKINQTLIDLWSYGYPINWEHLYNNEPRKRIPLPTYPFQREYFWYDKIISHTIPQSSTAISQSEVSFYVPTWIRDLEPMHEKPITIREKNICWIIFADKSTLNKKTIGTLKSINANIIAVLEGKCFERNKPHCYTINPKEKSDYIKLFKAVFKENITDYAIINFWLNDHHITHPRENLLDSDELHRGLYNGIFITQALSHIKSKINVSWTIVTAGLHSVLGSEAFQPLKSNILSLCRVLPLENPQSVTPSIIGHIHHPQYMQM
ncbi:MAG: type I polyketide synthase, partial [Gammaproteobacteria bacterium]|nr:type I polyketide synthase [Gammaproteobacteria bacterium]